MPSGLPRKRVKAHAASGDLDALFITHRLSELSVPGLVDFGPVGTGNRSISNALLIVVSVLPSEAAVMLMLIATLPFWKVFSRFSAVVVATPCTFRRSAIHCSPS